MRSIALFILLFGLSKSFAAGFDTVEIKGVTPAELKKMALADSNHVDRSLAAAKQERAVALAKKRQAGAKK